MGVPSRPVLQPAPPAAVHRSSRSATQPGDFPVTERVAASTLALPWSARLSDEDVRYVADALVEAVGRQFRA